MKKHVKQLLSLLLVCAMAITPSVHVVAAQGQPEAAKSAEPKQEEGETGSSRTEGNTQDSTKQGDATDQKGEGSSGQEASDAAGDKKQSEDSSKTDGKTTQDGSSDQTGGTGSNKSSDSGNSKDDTKKEDSKETDGDALDQKGEVTEPITKEDKPYLALGANLTADQQNTVLELLGINPAELSDYDVIYVTNEEEHQYLDAYVSKDKIGTRSLSSVLVVKREKGHGINITTKNISYCTIGMYKNALITAGITDADILVAGPTPISGTAALVGALKAYSVMTGEKVSEESIDTALNELVVTGDIAEAVGDKETAEELLAYLKQQIVEHGLDSEDEIRKAIEESCDKFDITLTQEETDQLVSLLKKIGELDLDIDSIMNQAKSLYDKLADMDSGGFFAKVGDFFQAIADFFQGLFGK